MPGPALETVPTTARLLELVDAMAGQPVAMLVDLVADRFITGTPKRISREAPVLILRYDGERFAPGGGANAVANVAALGGRPIPLGVVGDDPSGDEIRAWLDARGVDTGGILTRAAGYRTPTKTRILGGARHTIKQQIVRFDVEDRLTLEEGERETLLEAATAAAALPGGCRAGVLSDYGYGTVDPALVAGLRARLGAGCALIGDSRHRLHTFAGLDGATPNAEEAEALLGTGLDDDPERLAAAGRDLRRRLGTRFLLITRGSDGMTLVTAEDVVHLPVHGTDQVADVTGAGDTVIGTFALALAAGATPLEAACIADYAGGVVVMKMGTATLDRDELKGAIAGDPALVAGLRWAGS